MFLGQSSLSVFQVVPFHLNFPRPPTRPFNLFSKSPDSKKLFLAIVAEKQKWIWAYQNLDVETVKRYRVSMSPVPENIFRRGNAPTEQVEWPGVHIAGLALLATA